MPEPDIPIKFKITRVGQVTIGSELAQRLSVKSQLESLLIFRNHPTELERKQTIYIVCTDLAILVLTEPVSKEVTVITDHSLPQIDRSTPQSPSPAHSQHGFLARLGLLVFLPPTVQAVVLPIPPSSSAIMSPSSIAMRSPIIKIECNQTSSARIVGVTEVFIITGATSRVCLETDITPRSTDCAKQI